MTGGYTGKILRLNLTDHTLSTIDTGKYEEYGGGIGMGTAIFWDLVEDKSIDAFDPGNVITIVGSPLSGTLGVSAGARVEVNGIGPQAYPIGWFTRSNIGGRFGGEMKSAGWDGIAIEGKSNQPVWVKIVNDHVSFESAGELWGLGGLDTQKKIWEIESGGQGYANWRQLGSGRDSGRTTQRSAVMCIGPIGEAMVRDMGCLIHDAGHAAGQGGFGAVWGAKKLKAISITGTGSIEITNPGALIEARLWARGFMRGAEAPKIHGQTRGDVSGGTPPGNSFWGVRRESARAQSCISCPYACHRRQDTAEGNESLCQQSSFYEGFVFQKFGSITEEMNKAVDLVQKYGANTYSLAEILRYLATLNKMGVLGPGKTIDTDLPFDELGSTKFLEILFDKIIKGKDIGFDLRDGILRAAGKWGRLKEDLKSGFLRFPYWGYPEHSYDGRGSLEWGFGSIMGERDINEHAINDPFYWYATEYDERFSTNVAALKKSSINKIPITLQEVVERWSAKMVPFEGDPYMMDFSTQNMYSEHIAKLVAWQKYYSRFWLQGIGYCDFFFPDFVNDYSPGKVGMSPEAEPRFYNAVTGKNISYLEGMTIGRKVWNIQNAIWALQGRHRDMVRFADYYYDQPLGKHYPAPVFLNGEWSFADMQGRQIDREKFEEWKTLYYRLEGWDIKTGWPTRKTLVELGLGKVADELQSKGKLGSE